MHQTLLLEDPQPIQKTTWWKQITASMTFVLKNPTVIKSCFLGTIFTVHWSFQKLETISKSIFREENQQGWSLPNFWHIAKFFKQLSLHVFRIFETLVLIASLVPYFRSLQPISHLQVVIHVPFAGSLAHHGRLWQGRNWTNPAGTPGTSSNPGSCVADVWIMSGRWAEVITKMLSELYERVGCKPICFQ